MKEKVKYFVMKNYKHLLTLTIVATAGAKPCPAFFYQPPLSEETKLNMKEIYDKEKMKKKEAKAGRL